ncbi:uncharacterized protein LOC111443094 isoform X2 [Cucurbita moschata]|uniref:Uncharacterized protein LOC111443094 isoform X2 n=1 Tax=Cucurbita moschata TaxID=3662 RepID=A0A6J1F7M4_CUCMO|nr:uncharacterized protein LOC111443094 isoform X2 [Cucurbita moschata]
MAAMEKLFVQIFERKKWIIDQAKHQIDLFDQQLASKLIIDGIVPPPWLHSPFLHSNISHFEGVSRNFVPGVEVPRSPLQTHCSSLNEAFVANSGEELQQRLNEDAGSLNDDFDAGIRPAVLPQCNVSDARVFNCAPRVDTTPVSPQGRGGVVLENYQDPTLSRARLHRSKSRQRALELRNSAKSARCHSRYENKNDFVADGIVGSAISLLQADHEDESELAKPSSSCKGIGSVEEETNVCCEKNNISICSDKSRQRPLELRNSGKSSRCHSRYENKNDSIADGIVGSAISLLQADHEDESELAKPSSSCKGIGSVEEETNVCCEKNNISICSDKSRQRPLELRNSGKSSRCHSRYENKNDSIADGIVGSAISLLQADHEDESELAKPSSSCKGIGSVEEETNVCCEKNNISICSDKSRQRPLELRNSGKSSRCHSRYENKNDSIADGIVGSAISLLQADHEDESELAKPSSSCKGIGSVEEETNVCCEKNNISICSDKSRQRPLELRNSVKSSRCHSRYENKNDSIADGIVGSAISLLQADHEDESELAKPSSSCKGIGSVEEETNVCCEKNNISICSDKSRQRPLELRNSVKSSRCHSRYENKNDSIADGIVGSAISLLQADHEDESELAKPSSSCKGIGSVEEETNVCCEQKNISICSHKSRQRSLELRNSAKSARCHSPYENKNDSVADGIVGSAISSLRADHEDESELAKPSSSCKGIGSVEEETNVCCEKNNISICSDKSRQRPLELRNSVKSSRCHSRYENKNDSIADGIVGSAISLLQADHEDESELAKPSSSCKGIGSVEEETNVCYEQKNISICSDKVTIVGSPGLQSSSIDVVNSLNIYIENEGLCVAEGSTRNSYKVNEQFDSPSTSSGKIGYCEEGPASCRSQESNFDNAELSRLQCSSLDVDKSSRIPPEDGRGYPIGGSKLHSDQVDEQLDLPKPSSDNVECCEEAVLVDCRSQECNLDNALQSESQRSSPDVDDSACIDATDGRLLDLSNPSSGNVKCCEETILGHCRSQECNFDNAREAGSLYNSQDVDKSSYVHPEDRRSCPNGSSEVHSDELKERLDLSKSSSDNMECCEEEILGDFRSQEYNFNNAQKSGMQHNSLDADNSSCFSSENGTRSVGSSKLHSDQVSEPSELFRPSSANIECHEEGLGDCRTQDCNFDNNAEKSGLDKISSSPITEVREKTSDKKPSTSVDDKRDVNEKEKCNSPLHMPMPQIQVDSLNEDEYDKGVYESQSEKRYDKEVATCSLLQSDEPAEQNISLKDGVPNLQYSHENAVEIQLVDTDDASILIRDTETFRDQMVMAPCVPSAGEGDSNLEQQLKSSGITQCEDSGSFEGCTDHMVMAPCVPCAGEGDSNLEKPLKSSGITQCEDSDSFEGCTEQNGNHHYVSTECQTAETSIELKTFSSVLRASSSNEKEIEVELQLDNGIPASFGLRIEQLQIINRSPIDKDLMQEFDTEKPVLELQRLSFCEEGYQQPNVSIGPTEILRLEKEARLIQGSDSSSTLPVKEDLSRFGSNNRGTPLQNGMLESQSLVPEENFQCGDIELPTDTGKTDGMEEKGKLALCSLHTPLTQTSHYLGADKDMPALEGFLMRSDDEEPCISVGGINFDKLDLSKCMIERASILEKICKSACINSTLSSPSESFRLNKVTDLYNSLPNGLLECMDLKNNLLMNDQNKLLKDGSNSLNGEVNCSPHGSSFDCLQSFNNHSAGDLRKPFASPFGKLLDRNSLNSSSSGKRSSQNIELPCISEEAENTDEIDNEFSKAMRSSKRAPLVDITEDANVEVTVSEAVAVADRLSLESLNIELSNTRTHNGTKENLGNQKSSKRKYVNEAVSRDSLPGENGAKRVTRSSYNTFSRSDLSCKKDFRKEGPRFSEKESKHRNIVSNITSFIPLVQQREAATILKGKRDIKVKAIEAAEAAKRLAEKKENERQMKKEALKLERARMEQENLRQIELDKKKKEEERKKKEEERKKKEVDMAAKKRQREEEERKEKERKRMRVEEVRRRLREHGGKLRSDKENKEAKPQANDQKPRDRKGCKDGTVKLVKESGHDSFHKLSVTESKTTSTSDAVRGSFVVEDSQPTSVDFLEAEALENVMEDRISETSEEQSYQISPYKASDDEDEEDDDDGIQNNKFVPSWASKDRLAVLFASQKRLDPEIIFPPKSFCDIAEVLLPRQHQFK